eukprot:6839555-Heterocapsa_arctica.AAC.1
MCIRDRTKLDDNAPAEILFNKMTKPTELKEDIAHYDRRPAGAPDRSYQYLLNCMERFIDRAQHKRNRTVGPREKWCPLPRRLRQKRKKEAKAKAKATAEALAAKAEAKEAKPKPKAKVCAGNDTRAACYFHNHG